MNGEPNAPVPAPGRPPAGRGFGRLTSWLIAALAVSLALNAFVLGAVVGERWRGKPHHAHHSRHDGHGFRLHHVPGKSIRQLGAMLDKPARAKLRRAARPHKARMKLLLAEAAEARLDALDAMRAAEFDAAALESAFVRARKAEAEAAELTQSIIAEAAAQFTQEERAAVNKALEHRMELWRERVERRRKRLEKWRDRMERRQRDDKQD